MVDRGLAADRRVDLRKQRRRHLNERHAAHVAGRGEPGDVTDDAAAEREQNGLAITACREQGVEDCIQRGPILVRFAVRQFDHQHARVSGTKRGLQTRCVERRDGRVGHDRGTCGGGQAVKAFRIVEQTRADQNVVAAIAQFDGDREA